MTLILNGDGEIHRDWITTPSGLILSEDIARLRYAPPKHPQGGDVFSGGGGFACGAKAAGFQMRFAVEWDAVAACTYMHNLGAYPCTVHFETDKLKAKFEKVIVSKDPKTGLVKVITSGGAGREYGENGEGWAERRYGVPGTDHMWVWDIHNITGKMLLDPIGMKPGELDLLHGSPPCQGFSTAGRMNPHDPRNLLMLEYARLITEIQPKTFMLEQVPNVLHMTTGDGQPMLEAFIDCVTASGYASRKALSKMLDMQGGKNMLLRKSRGDAAKAEKPNRKSRRAEAATERRAPPEIAATLSRLRQAQSIEVRL